MSDTNSDRRRPNSAIRRISERLDKSNSLEEIFQTLNSNCLPVQEVALSRLRIMIRRQDCSRQIQSAILEAGENIGVVNAVAALSPESWTRNCDTAKLLRTALGLTPATSHGAITRLICRQLPRHMGLLFESLNVSIARILCFYGLCGKLSDEAIYKLVRFLVEHNRLQTQTDGSRSLKPLHNSRRQLFSPVLGLVVSPQWLAMFSGKDPVLAEELAEAFGYITPERTGFPCEHLADGVCFVSPELAAEPVADVREDLNMISRHLLSIGGTLNSVDSPQLHDGRLIDFMDLRHPKDQALFFAAVREYERADISSRADKNPLRYRRYHDETTENIRFLHVPAAMLHDRLITYPSSLADELSVPAEHRTRFLFEYVMTQLHLTDDLQTESFLFFLARWETMRVTGIRKINAFQPVLTQNGNLRFPEAIATVLPRPSVMVVPSSDGKQRLPAMPLEDATSPCAAACLKLMSILRHPGLSMVRSELMEIEKMWSCALLPVGVEIQIPHVRDSRHAGWKELFRSTGIPSPRRPECGRMLELALPPSISWHAPLHILTLVSELGVAAMAQDLAIHVSLQGKLGPIAGYLAFTQLFMNTSTLRSPGPRAALRHVMSKGLVHLNHDVVQCRWTKPATCRTELRVVIARMTEDNGTVQLDLEALTCIREIQLISSASVSQCPGLQELMQEFLNALAVLAREHGAALTRLMNANFFESTGDYRALELLETMEILQLREEVRSLPPATKASFRSAVSHLRSNFANRIEAAMASAHSTPHFF